MYVRLKNLTKVLNFVMNCIENADDRSYHLTTTGEASYDKDT